MRLTVRLPGGRDGMAVALATGVVGIAFLLFVRPTVPQDSQSQIPWWRFEAATAGLLIAIAVSLRRRPGLMHPILVAATVGVAGPLESAWNASMAAAPPEASSPAAYLPHGLVLLAALARTAVPVAILGLYASAPERALGRWVSPIAWVLLAATVVGSFLVVGRSIDDLANAGAWTWTNDLSYQLDSPTPVLLIGLLGLVGSLRAAGRAEAARGAADGVDGPSRATAPSRLLVAASATAALLWIPAVTVFLHRPPSLDDPDGTTNRLLFIPILAALMALVLERWSRIVAWSTVTVAFESVALLVFYRGAADYVTFAQSFPADAPIPIPSSFLVFTAAAAVVLLLAFAAVSIALRDGWQPDAAPFADRSWAIRGAMVGLGLFGWNLGGAFIGSGFAIILGAGLLPLYGIPVAVGLGAWRRVVSAVAEAERFAAHPFRPFRYLEIVVGEAVTGRAAHGRRVASDERERIASELQANVLMDLERIARTNASGAPREEIAERLRELHSAVRRLMADRRQGALEPAFSGVSLPHIARMTVSTLPRPTERELQVMDLVAAGASNEEIARELFVSLKTVESHLRRLFTRYDVTNRTELAVLAVREGWLRTR